jgi:glycosyltransferase involved in cell wall biosynthesis
MPNAEPLTALFLPHLDVSGGLGMHCRMVVTALQAAGGSGHFAVLSPADPAALFPQASLEPFDSSTVNADRFSFHRLEMPAGANLAEPLDPLLHEALAALKPSLLYCSYYTGMAETPCPQIVAFHDAGFLENPAGFGVTAAVRRATMESIRPAIAHLQCISHDARDRICRLLPWDVARTSVIWHALADPPDVMSAAKARTIASVKPYFFVAVGAATGFNRVRKNVSAAVMAFRKLNAPRATMMIAGTAPLTEKVLTELLPPGERGTMRDGEWESGDRRVWIVPNLPRVEFLASMAHAAAVVYPTRYEGFGLPVIEAMALGVPLIAANATSIPEIAGDAATLVDPDDIDGFAMAMSDVLAGHPALEAQVRRGLRRTQEFTLGRMGQAMLAMFDQQGANAARVNRS